MEISCFYMKNAGNLIVTRTEYLKDYKHAVVFITMRRPLKGRRGGNFSNSVNIRCTLIFFPLCTTF